jgi:hypothetical protein
MLQTIASPIKSRFRDLHLKSKKSKVQFSQFNEDCVVLILKDYYMTFSISALVLARDSHIKPDSKARGLIWVEGWYQGRYGKFHVVIFLSHILHWPFPSTDFYIAKKFFELTNCENKSLRELTLFNLQIFLFRVWLQKYTNQCRSVQWRQKQFVKSTWKTLTFEWKFLFNTTYSFQLIIPFQVI